MPNPLRRQVPPDRANTWRRVGRKNTGAPQERLPDGPPRASALRIPVRGLSAPDRAAPMALAPSGDRLWLSKDDAIETWQIHIAKRVAVARLLARTTLPGTVREITVAPDGSAYALVRPDCGGAALHRLDIGSVAISACW